jgi:hypothetical protein
MAEIPRIALERLARLRRLLELSRAAADGLHPAVDDARRQVEHATFSLRLATKDHHRLISVGADGLAYANVARERTTREAGSGAEYILETTAEQAREPKFDADARAVFDAKERLAEVMGQRREVQERAQALRRAVEAVEEALRARGWREGLATGEGLLRSLQGPRVVNEAVPPTQNMFQAARGAR